jgi:prepilin-type N-terminal cleavage/methylation domain-containing protein
MLQGARKRTAMTLVELLVVMAIIVIFTAMTAAFYPANQADRELSRFSNTVQSALLSARNRAKAERLPTGIRFYADPNSPTKVGSVVLIQKPAPLDGLSFGKGMWVTGNTINFVDSVAAIGVLNIGGEYIVLDSGEVARLSTTPMLLDSSNTNTGFISKLPTTPPPPNTPLPSDYTKFKIYRSAIELSGDTPFELSNIIEIQIPNTPRFPLPSFTQASYYPSQPLAPNPANPPLYFEIIFNPDGSLNNSTSEVYLHLHNFEAVTGDSSRDAILAVRKMSGSIGVYEVGQPIDFANSTDITKHNPNLFAKDPRNKGI